MTKVPTQQQREDWVRRIDGLRARLSTETDVHGFSELPHGLGDVAEVRRRILQSAVRYETVEGGCATRLLGFAGRLAAASPTPVGSYGLQIYSLARELIQYENLPSPGWDELLQEHGLPEDPLS